MLREDEGWEHAAVGFGDSGRGGRARWHKKCGDQRNRGLDDHRVQDETRDPEGPVTVSGWSEGTAHRLAEVEGQSDTI